MFSPTGRPMLLRGERSNAEDVIANFAQLTPQERAKRKLESLKALKKTFKKLDHDVNITDLLGARYVFIFTKLVDYPLCNLELTDQIMLMQDQLMELHERLSCWNNPNKIDSMEQLMQMEDSLRESINQIHMHKENYGKHQLLPLECTSQFQDGMPLPMVMSGSQEAEPLSWLPNNGNQHLILPNEPNTLPRRDAECSTDVSLPGYSHFFDTSKQTEIVNLGPVNDVRQESAALSGLSSTACLSSQLSEGFLFPPYCSLNLPDNKEFVPEMRM